MRSWCSRTKRPWGPLEDHHTTKIHRGERSERGEKKREMHRTMALSPTFSCLFSALSVFSAVNALRRRRGFAILTRISRPIMRPRRGPGRRHEHQFHSLVFPRRRPDAAARPDHRRQPPRHGRAPRPTARRSSSARRTTAPPTANCGTSVTAAARGLLALGVAPGDRVGVWSPNRYEWVVVQYATARVGAILVNVNPAYQAAELEYALRQSGAGVLFHARGFRQTGLRPPARRRPAALPRPAARPPLRRGLGGVPGVGRRPSPRRTWSAAKRRCSSTTPSTSSTPPARPDFPRAPRSPTTTSSTTASSSARRSG